MRADSLAYLSPQGSPPEVDPSLSKYVDLMHTTASPPFFTESELILHGNEQFDGVIKFREQIESQPQLHIVRNAEDLGYIERNPDKVGIIMGLHQAPYDFTESYLEDLYREGIRILSIAFGPQNPFGSGFYNNQEGLTELGKELIYALQEKGFIVDLSHAGHKTAEDAINFVENEGLAANLIVSHTGIHESYEGEISDVNNNRNLPEEVLAEIARLGGMVGIYALTFGLSAEDDTTLPFIRHMDKAVRICGETQVAIGSDGVYQNRDHQEWERHGEFMARVLAGNGEIEPRHPDIPLELNGPDKLKKLGRLLIAAGYSETQADSITGSNFTRYIRSKLPSP